MSKSVVIDAALGGEFFGEKIGRLYAKDWQMILSQAIYYALQQSQIQVAMTRQNDQYLNPLERACLIKDRYDFCISHQIKKSVNHQNSVALTYSVDDSDLLPRALRVELSEISGIDHCSYAQKTWKPGTDYYALHRLTGTVQTVIFQYTLTEDFLNSAKVYELAEVISDVLRYFSLGIQ